MAASQSALSDHLRRKLFPYDRQLARALGPPEYPCAHSARPRQPRVGTVMNESLDLHEITTVVSVALGESENGADERGWWPVLALTDEAHPVVLECNLN